nr:Chain C, NY-ESO-1 peptide analogue S9A [synthetic construct]
SLLMWITQA